MNRFPLWKYLLVILALVLGTVYALPNIYPDDPAVQISGSSSITEVNDALLQRATNALDAAGVEHFGEQAGARNALIRFPDNETQLRGKAVLTETLGDDYLVALNLAPTTPDWLVNLGATPMKLGLDLRGGVHFLMQVDMDAAIKQDMQGYASEMQTVLREAKVRYNSVTPQGVTLALRFKTAEIRGKAFEVLRERYNEFQFSETDEADGAYLRLSLLPSRLKIMEDEALEKNLVTLRNRVNELGVAEPLVQRQGRDRIVVELPGIQDTAVAKRIIGATANLEFRLEAQPDTARVRTEEFIYENRSIRLNKAPILTGANVSGASSGFDENGGSQVNVKLDGKGGKLMNRATQDAVGRYMSVLFIEHKTRTKYVVEDGEKVAKTERYIEKKVISFARIQAVLGFNFRITGLDSPQEASELALLLRAGSLKAPIYFVEERTVGPSLGQENIELGVKSVQIGLSLVVIFMLVYYRVFGLFANIALTLNLTMLIAAMSILGATLTLPGIAGIVLTVGMAVDANVLIFARIREELANGVPIQSAIHAGYERAFETIFDANLTTLIVAVILIGMGTGPVKGFAITLSIGILTSMFTAIVVTRAMVNLAYGNRSVTKLAI